MNKKGIAPLVATLLLISFAVALGVVIMTFGRAQVELEAQCPINVGLKLSKIGGVEQLCYDAAKRDLSFTVENGVNIDIEGLVVNVIGSEKAETFQLTEARMGKAGVYLGHIPFDGEIKQVKISPKVILYDNEEICTDKAVVVEELRAC